MTTIHFFNWLLWQAISASLYFWQVSLGVLVVAVVCIAIDRCGFRHLSLRRCLVVLAGYAIPFVILTWGAVMHYEGAAAARPVWRSYVIGALLLCLGLLIFASTWRFAGSRLLTLAVLLPPAWFSLCAAFIAAMSVTNDWI